MSFSIRDVEKVAHLARLGLTEDEKQKMSQEISGILSWIDELCKTDTSGVDPMFSVNKSAMPFRKDIVSGDNIAEEIVKNAPEKTLNMFVVPKVVE